MTLDLQSDTLPTALRGPGVCFCYSDLNNRNSYLLSYKNKAIDNISLVKYCISILSLTLMLNTRVVHLSVALVCLRATWV